MIVSERMYELGSNRSAIRELFEYGKKQAAIVGPEKVYDFSIGNPTVPAPDSVNETIRELMASLSSCELFGYTSAQGDGKAREVIAEDLNTRFGTSFGADNLYLTMGAAAALSLCFKALTTSPEDEFITIAPFFPEYSVFVEGAGAKLVVVPPETKDFQINFAELEKRITKNTKGVIINSPNNPSGIVYSSETIAALAELLTKKSEEMGHPVFIISDEPYREIVYDGREVPFVTKYYADTLVCYSYSKSLSLPGARIGYVLVPDEAAGSKELYAAICGAGRALGYVCAPSLFQKVIEKCAGQTGDIDLYRKNRDLLYGELTKMGYECFNPDGAFYLFIKAPETDSDAFCERAKAKNLLLVSATGFGAPGFVRISYCVDEQMIRRSFPAFKELLESYR